MKDVAASCLFHGRLPTSPCIFRPLSFPHLFPSLSLSLPTTRCLSVNELCVLSLFLFSSLVSGRFVLFFLSSRRGQGIMELSLAHWCRSSKVGQGRKRPGRDDSLCPPHRASSAICEQCVKHKTGPLFPPRPGSVCLHQWPDKGQKSMCGQRELCVQSEQ